MRVDGEAENVKASLRSCSQMERPPGGATLQYLGTPDVVDEHVDVAVVPTDLAGQRLHLVGIEMIDCDRDT